MLPATRRSRRWITLVVPLLGLIILLQQLTSARWQSGLATTTETQHEANFACPPAPGMEHVLIVMKTGVTEAPEKVPVHARTTFRCVPNYIVFSDFEEVVEGVQVHNVLRSVDKEVKEQIQDFDLYNRLERSGRKGLIASDATEDSNGAFGMPNNPGWKLDKWKFLPMIDEALKAKPDARWYVFMEADTHLVLPNLAAWLDRLNPDEPLYLGTETQIGDVLFGHGGSGVIVSHTAMRMASEHRAKRVAEYDQYTDEEWAGDMVLGKVLFDAGVDLTFTWPLLQNARLGEVEALTNSFYRQPWCWPVVGFHHLTPSDVEDMWRFDQDWFVKRGNKLLLHSDVFWERILPELSSDIVDDWDNLSEDVFEGEIDSLEDCENECYANGLCRQWTFRKVEDPDEPGKSKNECRTYESPRLGVKKEGVKSGWMMTRIKVNAKARGACRSAQWE